MATLKTSSTTADKVRRERMIFMRLFAVVLSHYIIFYA